MAVKVATATCVYWSQSPSIVPQPAVPSSLTLSAPKKRGRSEGSITWRYVQSVEKSALFGPASSSSSGLYRSKSCDEFPKPGTQSLRSGCSASFSDASSSSSWDQEFQHSVQESAFRFQIHEDANTNTAYSGDVNSSNSGSTHQGPSTRLSFVPRQRPFPSFSLDDGEEPEWPWKDGIVAANIERKANSVDLPLSLRIIKRKQRRQPGFVEAGDTACCSVKKAFSSTVFIVSELQCYTLRMREVLLREDLQAILARVQGDVHASLLWLFRQVFSDTPTLMVSVMILLANFTVHSMATDAASPTPEAVSLVQPHDRLTQPPKFDAMKMFTATPSSSGGGVNARRSSTATGGEDGSASGEVSKEEESKLWMVMVEEAKKMAVLDHDGPQGLVSPVTARIEADDKADHLRTELLYQTALAQDPNNALLLTNFAQFLYLVVRDYDRAEVYFKRAVGVVDSADAEAHSKYATFLWMVKKDLWAAEESFLEAISADPDNSHHAASYAHFLWSTGAEDTCFPLDSPDCDSNDLA